VKPITKIDIVRENTKLR